MSKFNETMIDGLLERISQIEPKASSTERAMDKVRQNLMHDAPTKTYSFQRRFVKMAIAAGVIIAVGLAIALLINNATTETGPNQKNVAGGNEQPEIVIPEMPTVGEQLAEVKVLYRAGDVDGLIAMLDSKEPEVAAASAGFLGMMGDERAIGALRNLAGKWQGRGKNPFQKAVDDISKRIDGGDTPAEPVEIPAEPVEPNAVETPVVYEEPQNVHIIYTQVMADGESSTQEIWLKMPDRFRENNPDRILIDNGVDRFTLNVQEKTALFEDSWIDTQPPSKHYMLKPLKMFRGQMMEGTEYSKNEKESTAKTIVYDLIITSSTPPGTGKAWVNAGTMLPDKLMVEITHDPNSTNQQGTEKVIVTCDYSPIADSIFAMDVPKDYTILPRKEREFFTGQVVDETGTPVAGAQVFIKTWGLQKQMTGVTDSDGFFAVNPPRNQMLQTPVAVWAVIPGDDEHIAWTLLRSDSEISRDKGRPFGGKIPGDPGEFDGTERRIKKADGILLQMEKAGRIFGMVTNTLGEPLENAEVKVEFELSDKNGNEKIGEYYLWPTTAKTNENGYYVVENLPRLWKKTRRRINVSAEGHNSKYLNLESDGPLDEREVNFEMLLTGITVRGTLHDNYGKPLAERSIQVNAGNGNSGRGCNTDKNGIFEIKDCAITDKLTVSAQLYHNSYPPHEKKKYASFVYYPSVWTEIVFEEDKFEYEVELVAELPEFTVEVYVVDSAGNPLPFYSVELRSWGRVHISHDWKSDRGFHIRADENGYCKLTGVPNIEQMRLVFERQSSVPSDKNLDEETKKLMGQIGEEYGKKYKWTKVDIEIVEGVKDYEITAVIPTKEEAEKERKRLKRLKKAKK